ncbi:AraC family transcriptional regulator [Dyadobacter luteus]|jgi:AraC-like DNA-binding protein|uniref:AraC family transcriptional regulator n=1 Tax=Dyadobacter luteus TaxID=2259619 RepID=A0A3D8YI55_9BACT|nr:AraC family transcriptional regulator [Dyadobacter luteus]REA64462.1 AraC family transcriptional regulator [Dyadobacter luteus]
MRKQTENLFTDSIVYSLDTAKQTEYDNLLEESVLLLQLSGEMTFETSGDRITARPGEVYLVKKHQFVKTTKTPKNNEFYKALMFVMKEDILREYALENQMETKEKYRGESNILLPESNYIKGFFNSLIPYTQNAKSISHPLSILKVKEAIELLLQLKPDLRDFLFDFSEPHKIDLEKFMQANFKFNVPIENFARLTGRSLAGFKRDFDKKFGIPPRQWLQNKRLAEAHFQIVKHNKKPSSIYLELGFESLSHFSYAFKKQFGYSPKASRIQHT